MTLDRRLAAGLLGLALSQVIPASAGGDTMTTRKGKPSLEIAQFDYPPPMLEATIQFREALVAQIRQTDRFLLRGPVADAGSDPNALPDQEAQSGLVLTGVVHRLTRATVTRTPPLGGTVINIFTHTRPVPERRNEYTFTTDLKLVDRKTQELLLATQIVKTADYPTERGSTDAIALRKLVRETAEEATRQVLACRAASLETEVAERPSGGQVMLNAGFEDGVRENQVFSVFESGRREPVCQLRVNHIDRTTCRAELGSIDYTALGRDRERSIERAFRPDRSLAGTVRAGMTARSEN